MFLRVVSRDYGLMQKKPLIGADGR
jgi:hypothetical protein